MRLLLSFTPEAAFSWMAESICPSLEDLQLGGRLRQAAGIFAQAEKGRNPMLLFVGKRGEERDESRSDRLQFLPVHRRPTSSS